MADKPAPSQFGQTLADLLDSVSYRRVDLEEQLDPVYRLRYDAYRREEFIALNSQKVAGDKYDHTPNVYCFGVYVEDQLVSSIRLHHTTPECRESPSRSIYPDLLDPWLDAGKSYLDPSRFTADHEASLSLPGLPFLTTRIVAMAIHHFEVDYCLSTVRPEHGAFYRRMFHFQPLGDVRYYEGLHFPVKAFYVDARKWLPDVYARYPFFQSTEQERDLLFADPGKYTLGQFVKASARTVLEAETDPSD
jgi:hypothetical protein